MLREEAIKKHRAMWNWIAEQIVTNERTMNIAQLKAMYIDMQDVERIEIHERIEIYKHNNCYLCHFTGVNCTKCPLLWPGDDYDNKCEYGYFGEGLYSRCLNLMNSGKWKLQAELAYEIANLPEREMSK